MKQVIEQYASAIIAVFVAVILFSILNKNMFVLGNIMEYSLAETAYCGNQAFDIYMEKGGPVIQLKEKIELGVNQKEKLTHYFKATDMNGKELPVYVNEIRDASGDLVVLSCLNELCFSQAGVYWLEVYTIDENQKETSLFTNILVNEG